MTIGKEDLLNLKIGCPPISQAHTWPVLEMCFFSTLPRAQLRNQILESIKFFNSVYGIPFAWYKLSDSNKSVRLDDDAIIAIDRFFNDQRFTELGLLGLEIYSGEEECEYEPPSMEFFSSGMESGNEDSPEKFIWRSLLRLCIPIHELPINGKELLDSYLKLAEIGNWNCGHAGISIYWNITDEKMERELARHESLLSTYPCMEYHDMMSFWPFIGHGLLQVGWITLVGEELCEKLGNKPSLRDFNEPMIEVVNVGKDRGVLIIAGPAPILGSNEANQSSPLVAYKNIGQELRSIRVPDERIDFMEIIGLTTEEKVRSWYLRFFGHDSPTATA